MIVAASFVVLDSRTVVREGAVRIRFGAIDRVGSRARLLKSRGSRERVEDLPDAVVLPGLVNAHVHLELSALAGKTPRGAPFAEWLGAVVRERRKLAPAESRAAMRAALASAILSGTTAFGEISSAGSSARELLSSGVRAVVFEEAISLDPATAPEAERELTRRLSSWRPSALCRRGVSPHAPYSVSAELYRRCARLAREKNMLLATHAAETPEEEEFVARGAGPLRAFLANVGALPDGRLVVPAAGRSPTEYLESIGVLSRRTILAHGNRLSRADVARVARSGATVVFCPGTHRFFGRPAHPLPRLLRAGARVALGTDGLSSNERLDLFSEMSETARFFPALSPATIFELATRGGARALGLAGAGRLRPGAEADLVAVEGSRPKRPRDVIESLVGEGPRTVRLVLVGGKSPGALRTRRERTPGTGADRR